jgi:8-oxo-dGTP pyrophosphatase MutT (NUDIX family)
VPVPDFVQALRRRVGTELLWLTGVSGVVVHEGRVLLTLRPEGRWTVPSGILEPGEQPAPALERELLEETGVRARVDRLVDVVTQAPMVYPGGDRAQYLDLTFACTWVSGTPHAADDENLDARWFALDDLPELDARNSERLDRALRPDPSGQPWFAR